MKKVPLTALVLALFAWGCQESQTPEPDAGTEDAATDTGTDGAIALDAASDASTVDAADADEPDSSIPLGPTCTSNVPSAATATQNVALCEVDGPVRHVRITGVMATQTHASAQFFLGIDGPTGPQAPLSTGEFKLQLYGGGSPGPAPQVDAYFGNENVSTAGDHAFVNAISTICFDIHDGSATTRAAFVLWRDDEDGADCEDLATLTIDNAYATMFAPTNGAITKDANAYFYQAAPITATPAVTLSTSAALTPEEAEAGLSCEVTWQTNVLYQPLCTPAVGPVRHVRVEDVASATANKYFYLVFGDTAAPVDGTVTAPPATVAGDGRFIYTGGHANSGSSWTYFRFNGGSTTQFDYAAGEPPAALYTSGPSTVCFDLVTQETSENLRLVFWATGANAADCDDHATLTAASALYDSSTASDTFWNAELAETAFNFVKISGSTTPGATIGRVVVYAEPALH